MRSNGQGHTSQSPSLSGSQDKGELKLVADTDSPDRDNVVSMLRHGVGSVLEGLSEAKDQVRDARRLHEIAASVGDEEVETMIGHELRQVEEAAKVA
jgi:hypothetical protein